jgi:hypothetical protein
MILNDSNIIRLNNLSSVLVCLRSLERQFYLFCMGVKLSLLLRGGERRFRVFYNKLLRRIFGRRRQKAGTTVDKELHNLNTLT